MAGQQVSRSRRLPWTVNPSPTRCPAAGIVSAPVKAAARPSVSTTPTWRTSGVASLASGGMSKSAVKQWLFEHATIPLAKFSREGIERRFRRKLADRYANAPLDAPVRMWAKPEDLIVIVTGGAGKHSQYVPTFGNTRSVTRRLRRADGEFVKSVQELKRG